MNWQEIKLGEAATFYNGYAFKPSHWSDSGAEIIRIQNLTKSGTDINFFNGNLPERYRVRKGDLLISWSATLGIFEWEKDDAWLNQHIFKVVFDKLDFDKSFFKHLIDSSLRNMEREVHGSTMKHITKKRFDNLRIPYPPLPTQKKIAAILDAADTYRQKTKILVDKYDELAQSLFLDMFGENDVEGIECAFNDLALKSEVPTFSNGPFGSDLLSSELTSEGVPVIYIRDIASGIFKWKSGVYVTPTKADQLKACQVQPMDVLITKVGDPPGTAALYPVNADKAIMTQDVIRIRVNENKCKPYFLIAWFNSAIGQHELKKIIVEGTRKRFGLRDLKGLTIKLPSIEKQQEFTNYIMLVEGQKEIAKQELSQSIELFNSLLQKAFKGELI